MLNTLLKTTAAAGVLTLAGAPGWAHTLDAMLEELDPATLGEVNFETSCNEQAQAAFQIGLLLLHHMMYRQSDSAFRAATEADPDCAMAQWGIAMTNFHPLWPGGPTPDEMAAGKAAVDMLSGMQIGTQREQAYVGAVKAFYSGEDLSFPVRLDAWAEKQRAVYDAYPDDIEAAAFDALAQLTVAPRGAEAVPELRDAGQRMDALRTEAPRHPGGYHYAIHAYDHPALAEMGLEVARAYDSIAPKVPHALHMPSHIFTRLGLWAESADWNARSAAAVLEQHEGETIVDHYPHAIDYSIYAHLQAGNVEAAMGLLEDLAAHLNLQDSFGSAYAMAAAPARLPLETGDWAAAAGLPTSMNPALTWERYPQAVGMRWFAVGIGAARSGDLNAARTALDELAGLREMMTERGMGYWVTLGDAQAGAIEAWVALAEGDEARARELMTTAAETEDAVGKAPVTPGHVLPARELLGDLLLELGEPDAAARAF
ncbi:hypothetical protein [Salipiger mucosus]|uniref:TPR repeat protein n=1 Tax=Salipiger mucosus DSM 16094 TaxID=1123237 RepID=S9S128_9RHOB|nr:hypothetical protein [Salipiger mucosus]EPX83930.1 hypothetical protein Salmuc_01705 [Salipiger mucosus DSM 16094]